MSTSFMTNALKLVKRNSPEILTALGVVGVVSTSVLASKASFEAAQRLDPYMEPDKSLDISNKEKLKIVWKLYIPTAISGTVTIGCIIGASKANSSRTAAAVTAYSLTERAFAEYREKVVEQVGKGKNRKVRDDLAQDHVTKNPPVTKEVIVTGKGHILCCELYTHRYFRADKESLDRSVNEVNFMIVHNLYVCMDEFYDLIGLPYTSESDKIGWESDKLMELEYTTVLSEDGEPCLAFIYNYVKPLFK